MGTYLPFAEVSALALDFQPHAFLEVPDEKKADVKLDFGAAAKA